MQRFSDMPGVDWSQAESVRIPFFSNPLCSNEESGDTRYNKQRAMLGIHVAKWALEASGPPRWFCSFGGVGGHRLTALQGQGNPTRKWECGPIFRNMQYGSQNLHWVLHPCMHQISDSLGDLNIFVDGNYTEMITFQKWTFSDAKYIHVRASEL